MGEFNNGVPQYPRDGADHDVARFMEDMYKGLEGMGQPAEEYSGRGMDTDYLRQLVLSRIAEVHDPSPLQPELGMSEGQRVLAKQHEDRRLQSALSKVGEVENKRAELYQWYQANPKLSADIGVTKDWFDESKRVAFKGAHRGWKALDAVLKNVDRFRGAISSYSLAVQEGGTKEDAQRKAKAAFLGSTSGWVFNPEIQGPAFREVLHAAGYDDELSTSIAGFAMDVLVDPVNLLGFGASRKGIEVGAHQILNKLGGQMYGKVLKKSVDDAVRAAGVGNELALPEEALRGAYQAASAEMRSLIRKDPTVARQYLDMGGLKFAGYTLPGTAFLRKKEVLRNGIEFDYVSENLVKVLGGGSLRGMDKIGRRLSREGTTTLEKRLGAFVEAIPATMRRAGHNVGMVFSRTNPTAGKEYKNFKQAEYYDRLGFEDLRVKDEARVMFEGVSAADLNILPFKIEEGEQALQQFLQEVSSVRGAKYGAQVGKAVQEYRQMMDAVLVDEVKRKFYRPKWSEEPGKVEAFEAWVKQGVQPQDAKWMKEFGKARVENYVPHIFHNTVKARSLAPPPSTPRGISIVEPYTKKRIVKSLQEGVERGLVPETNIAAIAATRMMAYSRAMVTHEFLEEAVTRFGATRSGIAGVASEAIRLVGNDVAPEPIWEQVLKMRTNSYGKIPVSIAKQLDIARHMAMTANVPTKAVSKLDDVAIKEFLNHRLRIVTMGKGRSVWDKYVVNATKRGEYDGFKLAPARELENAVARARDLVDPAYPDWAFVKAGGVADPDKLGDMLFPVPIKEDLERISAQTLPEEFRRMLKLYDVGNYWWKRNVTVIWPAFHLRNKMTNVINSAADIGIAGVMDRGAMTGIIRGDDGVINLAGGVRMSYSQVRQLARRLGVARATFRRADISEMMQDVVRTDTKATRQLARQLGMKLPGREKLLKRGEIIGPTHLSVPFSLGTLHQAGGELGMLIENADRLQLFVKSLQRGMSPEQAARRVNRFLFDYDDISNFEKDYVRRFFAPFWTWTRKNIALQARVAANTPGRFVAPAKFFRAFSVEKDDAIKSDVERQLLPEYISETFSLRTGAGGPIAKWMTGFDFPHEDLNRVWSGDFHKTFLGFASSMAPIMTEALEAGLQYDFYRGQKRVEFIRGTKVFDVVGQLEGTKVGNWLGVRKEFYRDQTSYRVDAKKWNFLLKATVWQTSRLYTTLGQATEKSRGNIYHRLFGVLTGARHTYVNPGEELRRMADKAISDRDTGLLANMRKKYADMQDITLLDKMAGDEADALALQTNEAIRTPSEGGELAVEDTLDWVNAD